MMPYCEPRPNFVAECFFVRNLSGKTTSFVMVEGETDRAALEQFAAGDCALFPSRGKDNVLYALKSDGFIDVPGIAGIIDLDYTLLTNEYDDTLPNLLFDDCYPDLEMIVLNSSKSLALKAVMQHALKDENYEVEQVCEFTLTLLKTAQRLAAEFGYFRLLNDCKKDYKINFKSFEYSYQQGFINFSETDFIDSGGLELRREWTALRLAESSKKQIDCEELLRETAELRENHPPHNIQLCRGKDVIAIIVYILPCLFQSHFGTELPYSAKETFQEIQLAKELRKAYKCDYFKRTSLCSCIRSWESANSPYKILKPEI